ncbi:MAG: ABC transporter ATP-binding protein [Clostridium sp.]|nr:ABC transporter ATP-binding protein [Clostridium sp.]
MSIIEVKDLRKSYIDGDGKKEVLKGITFSAKENEFVVILGKSGSGKSTFMNILGGLDKADEGTILIDGQPLVNGTDKEMSRYRRNTIGFIFQSFNLIPVMNVYENIVLPLRIDGKKIEDSYIDDLLNNLDIMDKKNSMPMRLSGGEQQRVAIARALANKPRIILADEPTGNLDSATGDKVLELLISGIRKYGQTLIMITHNEEIANMADRVVYMREGQLLDK